MPPKTSPQHLTSLLLDGLEKYATANLVFNKVVTELMNKTIKSSFANEISFSAMLARDDVKNIVSEIFKKFVVGDLTPYCTSEGILQLKFQKPQEMYKLVNTLEKGEIEEKKFAKFKFEIVYRLLAIRVIAEINAYEVPFPYFVQKPSKDDMIGKYKSPYHNGVGISDKAFRTSPTDFFTAKERLKVARHRDNSPVEVWNNPSKLLPTMRKAIIKGFGENDKRAALFESRSSEQVMLSNRLFMRAVSRDKAVDSFRPLVVKDIISIIKKRFHKEFEIKSAFDPCGGWGDRLFAFIAEDINYITYNDVNPELKVPYTEIIAHYKSEQQQVNCLFKPAEELTVDEICSHGLKHDLILTGTPFFLKEKYTGAAQSHLKHPEINDWLKMFLFSMVARCAFALNDNGFMAININDVKLRSKQFYLVDPLIHFLSKINFIQYLGTPPMPSRRQGSPPSAVVLVKRLNRPAYVIENLFTIINGLDYVNTLSECEQLDSSQVWSCKKDAHLKDQWKITNSNDDAMALPVESSAINLLSTDTHPISTQDASSLPSSSLPVSMQTISEELAIPEQATNLNTELSVHASEFSLSNEEAACPIPQAAKQADSSSSSSTFYAGLRFFPSASASSAASSSTQSSAKDAIIAAQQQTIAAQQSALESAHAMIASLQSVISNLQQVGDKRKAPAANFDEESDTQRRRLG